MTGQSKPVKAGCVNKCPHCGAEVQNLYKHSRENHVVSSDCLLCGITTSNRCKLLIHLKNVHGHLLGYLLPVSAVVEERRAQEHAVNIATIQQEITALGLSDLGGTWLQLDEFFVSYDIQQLRPLVVVELLTTGSLADGIKLDHNELPYKQDEALPLEQPLVTQLRRSNKNVSHLATGYNHRITKEANDMTFLVRNLVRLHTSVNQGILFSVEAHLSQVASNWWKSVLVTVPVYDDRQTGERELPEPSHIVKLMILGDHHVQYFIIPNSDNVDPNAANFIAVRATLQEVNDLTGLNFATNLPCSWDAPLWKCEQCRFMSNEKEELKLHNWFAHKEKYCPVHEKREEQTTFAEFKCHVGSFERRICTVQGCDSWFYNRKSLSSHTRRVHTTKDWPCAKDDCDKSFKTEIELNLHLETHKADRERISCDLCDFTCLTKGSLKAHVKDKHRQASSSSPVRVNTRRTYQRNNSVNENAANAARIAQLSEQNALLSQQNAQLSQQNAQLSQQNAQLSQQNGHLSQQNSQLSQENAELRQQQPQHQTTAHVLSQSTRAKRVRRN